jgi:ApbE superfamily uncharacterized protein (UPF0280 family)
MESEMSMGYLCNGLGVFASYVGSVGEAACCAALCGTTQPSYVHAGGDYELKRLKETMVSASANNSALSAAVQSVRRWRSSRKVKRLIESRRMRLEDATRTHGANMPV